MKSIIFIHRSVGENLITEGNLYKFIDSNIFVLEDINQNNGQLRNSSKVDKTNLTDVLENTTPKDFAQLFSSAPSQLKDYTLTHDIVIIKSCYPNSNICSDHQLKQVKSHYCQLFEFFSRVSAELVIITSPPLRYGKTNLDNAKRARELANWLVGSQSNNIHVFDLFDLLSEKDGKRANTLKKEYQRFWFFDSHPNEIANEVIAPLFADFIHTLISL